MRGPEPSLCSRESLEKYCHLPAALGDEDNPKYVNRVSTNGYPLARCGPHENKGTDLVVVYTEQQSTQMTVVRTLHHLVVVVSRRTERMDK